MEASWSALEAGGWRSKVTPATAAGSVLGWIACGVPFLFTGSREAAAKAVFRMLFIAARRHWRIARSLIAAVQTESVEAA